MNTHVAELMQVLRDEPGIIYELCPLGTVVDADSVDTLLFVVAKKMHAHALSGSTGETVSGTSFKMHS